MTCGEEHRTQVIRFTGDNTDHWREQWHAAFFQDTWRVTSRITLTPGIQWENFGALHSITNKMGNFDPNQPNRLHCVG
jgi:outer membrane receptor for ferrienterochelin and colicin